MPSNLKGKNFVSKIPWYCPQNTMAFFSSKLDGIKQLILQAIPAEYKCPHILIQVPAKSKCKMPSDF
jgi:hypothetical protein